MRELTFRSHGETCTATHVAALTSDLTSSHGRPCVVMARGVCGSRDPGLVSHAARFTAEGYDVLLFDYARQERRTARRERADLRAAIEAARRLPDVDPDRIVLWAYSFAGGHVTSLLGRHSVEVFAALVLCPFADGLKRALATPLRVSAWIIPRAILDVLGRNITIPVTAPLGGRAAMAFAGEEDGFANSVTAGSRWRNQISPGVFLTVALFRPFRRAARIRPPLWVGRCAQDITVDARAVAEIATRAPQGELHDFEGDHFAPFTGESTTPIIDSQVDFLRRVLAAA